jgi:arylsulfatase A-like enzyme
MLGLAHRGFSLNHYSQHLVSTLKRTGYLTALAGFQHVAKDAALIGYDSRLAGGASDGQDDRVSQAAVEFLEGRPAEPFYLEVGFMDTHREFPEPPDDDPRYVRPPDYYADDERTRYDFACYMKSARRLDGNVGQVLDALEKSGLASSTLVICTTDHGAAFPRMKCNLTDSGIGVMLMMRGPGGFEGGRVVDALVSHLDVFPTLCDILEIDRPAWTRGASILPLLSGAVDKVRDEIYAEVNYHAAYEPQRCIRTDRWKYIRRLGDRRKAVLPNCDDGPTKTVWMEKGWGRQENPREALYDLAFDPTEVNNMAEDPAAKTVLGDMRKRLDRWMGETRDPLLKGAVPAPSGARVNDPDGISPTERPGIVS